MGFIRAVTTSAAMALPSGTAPWRPQSAPWRDARALAARAWRWSCQRESRPDSYRHHRRSVTTQKEGADAMRSRLPSLKPTGSRGRRADRGKALTSQYSDSFRAEEAPFDALLPCLHLDTNKHPPSAAEQPPGYPDRWHGCCYAPSDLRPTHITTRSQTFTNDLEVL